MSRFAIDRRQFLASLLLGPSLVGRSLAAITADDRKHLLYVAEPGIRDYLEYGGHGVLVFDIDNGHKFVRRIASKGTDENGKPRNVKGICASSETNRMYVATTHTMTCYDLKTDNVLWERAYPGGCDRMSIAPDGSFLYVPSFEGDTWNVVEGKNGDVVAVIEPKSGAHNTVYGPTGKYVYLAGLKSPLLTLVDPTTQKPAKTVGPFSAAIRPFTVNADESIVFATVNGLLGYEMGDVKTGKMIRRVEVEGYKQGPVKRHGCPSHGIGLTPDGTQVWVCDAFNQCLHVYSADLQPKALATIKLRDEPGWIKFGIDGKLAYPSTGEVIDVASRKIVATLTDEQGRAVQSEKMIDLIFEGTDPVAVGDQFGRGMPAKAE